MKVISEQNEFAESAGAARPGKRLCLEFSNVMVRSILRLCQTGICADFRVEEKWIQEEILDIPLRLFAPVRMKYYAGKFSIGNGAAAIQFVSGGFICR
jgi:hypothetical protein